MNLYPAIDILGGNAVRLVKGDFDAKKVYDEHPLSAARAFVEEGAKWLHIVDLDGAKGGEPVNLEHVSEITRELGVPTQLGGGLRSDFSIQRAFEAGVSRVILGTAIFSDPELPFRAMEEHGAENVLISIDARDGFVATHGWLEKSELPAQEAIERWSEGKGGVKHFVFTNIDHDGMLSGPDVESTAEAVKAARHGRVIHSGGIGELVHLELLQGLGLDGVIVGKALYERRFTVAEALAVLDG
ncbi:MAG TPA: 1-(5-phosphoribosyl)-5-[(5-phosphoribosylamino)methylideneamino]imidazole-4-carboxamide isomerase [Solirubrobacteraceae bacterium]|nr:1-(5-phosphoribosyl)-5-[(5-phosphoribosylamino)methylideneamino]imidazole-4-carboxamide isomerase [Solirubrobacteraceae bacterium]